MGLNGPRLDLSQFEWEPTGPDENPRARLLSTLYIDGWAFHVEAIQVKPEGLRDLTVQAAESPEFDDNLDHYYAAAGADGPFQTLGIEGRDYVVVMTPFCR